MAGLDRVEIHPGAIVKPERGALPPGRVIADQDAIDTRGLGAFKQSSGLGIDEGLDRLARPITAENPEDVFSRVALREEAAVAPHLVRFKAVSAFASLVNPFVQNGSAASTAPARRPCRGSHRRY
jgi:hypothetical protein